MNTALSLQLNSCPIPAGFGCKIRPFFYSALTHSNAKLSAAIHPLPGLCLWPRLESRAQGWPALPQPLLSSSAGGFFAVKLKLINCSTEQELGLIVLWPKATLVISWAVRVWSEVFDCCCLVWACSSSSWRFDGQGRLPWCCVPLGDLTRVFSLGFMAAGNISSA